MYQPDFEKQILIPDVLEAAVAAEVMIVEKVQPRSHIPWKLGEGVVATGVVDSRLKLRIHFLARNSGEAMLQ